MSTKILVGADPEVFVIDNNTGKVINAHGMVEGTKEFPFAVKDGAVQVDGMALEFNINPAENMEEFQHNIESVRDTLHKMIGTDRYSLHAAPSVMFSQEDMDDAPKVSKELGCEPDFNAWSGDVNPPPDHTSNMRTGAGHVHVGWTDGQDAFDPGHFDASVMAAKQLDCALGVQSLLWDEDNTRRELYGKAGAFRSKPYGMEYRVLSNIWLGSKELVGHVYNVTVKSMEDLMEGVQYFEEVDAEDIINKGDVGHAEAIIAMLHEKYGVPSYV